MIPQLIGVAIGVGICLAIALVFLNNSDGTQA